MRRDSERKHHRYGNVDCKYVNDGNGKLMRENVTNVVT